MAATKAAPVSKWDTAAALPGLDLIDKAELVGKEFMITAVWFDTNARSVDYAYFDGEFRDGEKFSTNDSGTGIRSQLLDYLGKQGKTITNGEIYDVAILVPKGLRVSKFKVQQGGKEIDARTYYLTVSGVRAA